MIYLALFVLGTAIAETLGPGRLLEGVSAAKSLVISGFEWFGDLGMFCARLVRAALARPYELGELVRQCDSIGSKSLPLVALAGGATGVVLSLQIRDSLTREPDRTGESCLPPPRGS